MKNFSSAILAFIIIVLLAIMTAKQSEVKQKYKKQAKHIELLSKQNEAFRRYFCATEELLDLLPINMSDTLTTTKQGFRYIEEKYRVDSICFNVHP